MTAALMGGLFVTGQMSVKTDGRNIRYDGRIVKATESARSAWGFSVAWAHGWWGVAS
jgi:hypothetical protein